MIYAKTFNSQTIPFHLRTLILSEMAKEWPAGFTGELEGREWIHPEDAEPIYLVLFAQEQAVAFCSIMHKVLEWQYNQIKLNGLSGVLVFSEYRSKGFGQQLLQEAEKYLQQENMDLSVLSCAPHLIPFYQQIQLNPIESFTLLVGNPNNPNPDHEPFMAKARTELGTLVIQDWIGKSIYFGEYSW